jgi:predicted AAA+ superfamily ATPase
MHLRHHGLAPDYYVTRGGAEIDFIYHALPEDEARLVQVCWDIGDPQTRKREVQGLLQAMQEVGSKRGTIVTWLDEETPAEGIDVVPAWKWLLQQPS